MFDENSKKRVKKRQNLLYTLDAFAYNVAAVADDDDDDGVSTSTHARNTQSDDERRKNLVSLLFSIIIRKAKRASCEERKSIFFSLSTNYRIKIGIQIQF